MASGSLDDEGLVEGTPLLVDEDQSAWIGYRMLKGRKGLLFLLVDIRFVRRGPHNCQRRLRDHGWYEGIHRPTGKGRVLYHDRCRRAPGGDFHGPPDRQPMITLSLA